MRTDIYIYMNIIILLYIHIETIDILLHKFNILNDSR